MGAQSGMPEAAAVAIGDLLDCCAKVEPGQEVVLIAERDGLFGGDGMVDEQAVAWVQSAVQARGANASVLWVEVHPKIHEWRLPAVAKAAMGGCDIAISFSFNLGTEEIPEFRDFMMEKDFKMVRNFATTAPLLCTPWAQTPYELVSEIRWQMGLLFHAGAPFKLTDPNGTHLEGVIREPVKTKGIPGGDPYATRRGSHDNYYPWPEWMHQPVQIDDTNGVFVFESMLSWWSRYMGIPPYFDNPIELTIEDDFIKDVKGGYEADALKDFLQVLRERLGENVYKFDLFHFGVHPQASVGVHQCPNPIIRRLIEHSHCRNLHFHIGDTVPTKAYPYNMHITGDIRTPTLRVGDTVVSDAGYMTVLDNPEVLALVDKYPGRPGVVPAPRSW